MGTLGVWREDRQGKRMEDNYETGCDNRGSTWWIRASKYPNSSIIVIFRPYSIHAMAKKVII